MGGTAPEVGLVIPYWFLWRREFADGEESGRKARPVVVVVAVARSSGVTRVAVAPVTHTEPDPDRGAVEVPTAVKALLKLDGERSWVVCDELNEFNWPGYDVAKTPDGRSSFGRLPHGVTQRILLEAAAARHRGALKITDRD